MSEALTADQVLSGLARARGWARDWVPDAALPGVLSVVDALSQVPEEVALIEAVGLARLQTWWKTVAPFTEPPVVELRGVAAGISEVYGAAASIAARRDREKAAFSAVTRALLAVGWEAVEHGLPLVLAAIPR